MKNYVITEFEQIKGIGSASGLIYYQNVLFIISDNSTYLYQYIIDKKLVLKFPLVDKPQENITKKDKLDLEALTHFGNQIFIFGSGSTAQRNTMFSLNLENDALQKKSVTDSDQLIGIDHYTVPASGFNQISDSHFFNFSCILWSE